ncbi:cell division ATP-binding protein FtsE [candidate division WWE3 bacterium CG_4_9_14_3_um_filter_41_6]|uniref:Cell division ATP-binding protein FtsE n=1 Tax=candidate division WWE3 bacterium CG_4_10_14_0_2_um_filter_41_14 TaxID=1975072 RepID=A0A2M7TIF2_UNCKA|nr:MAG: cell division ATP-binding protein FtsE [candidate division WWE3 bacterium CG_4_10_14_0_2_um_filter_41_14]PJA38107.1 MAG: cell division ATP-binding protein FtsE [candidate division WWE3 bacterium CG_4_9_14_3_um_filter_41_6]
MITFDHVTKLYDRGSVTALNDVSLDIKEKDLVVLVGPSGAGKTTLLRLLIKEENPTHGAIYFKEDDIVKLSKSKVPKLRRSIGMIFQDFKLLKTRNVYENVAFALEVTRSSTKEIGEVVPYLLDKVGLSYRAKAFPNELSTGEQQRVAIARALVHEPEVLLADEPTGNLDRKNSEQIVELLQQINDWGTTIIIATHDEYVIKTIKGRTIELDDGKVVLES